MNECVHPIFIIGERFGALGEKLPSYTSIAGVGSDHESGAAIFIDSIFGAINAQDIES